MNVSHYDKIVLAFMVAIHLILDQEVLVYRILNS